MTINDDADGGCWTNIGEVKTYAEEKLRLKGYEVLEEDTNSGFEFWVTVNAFRANNGGLCVGSYSTAVQRPLRFAGMLGYLEVGEHSTVGTHPDNFNQWELEHVSEMVGAM